MSSSPGRGELELHGDSALWARVADSGASRKTSLPVSQAATARTSVGRMADIRPLPSYLVSCPAASGRSSGHGRW